MAIAIAVVLLAASLFLPLSLRAWAGFHWFTAWLVGAMVVPGAIWLAELFEPSGWGWVVFIFWGIPAAGLAALGTLFGWLINRKTETRAAP
jgi:hypothetical protein